MSDKSHEDELFSNEDTLVRRAWIDSALNSVRSRLNDAPEEPALGPEAFNEETEHKAEGDASSAPAVPRSDSGERPRLYVAWSADERRSGT